MRLPLLLALTAALPAASAPPQEGATVAEETTAEPQELDLRELLRGAPRRRKIGKMRSVRARSTVVFPTAPDHPHELEVSFAFPGRTRMVLKSAGATNERYEIANTYFARDTAKRASARENASYRVTGDSEAELSLDLALRRALFLWPDEGDFVGDGTTRTAKVANGVIMATLDAKSGLPTRVVAFDTSGRSAAELRCVEWREAHGRRWPSTFEYAAGKQTIWTETVGEIDTEWLLTDVWFIPPDRVAELLGGEVDDRIRIRPHAPVWVERVAFEGDDRPKTLKTAVDRAVEQWRGREASLRESTIAIVVSGSLEPLAIEFSAAAGAENDATLAKRKGWTRRDAGSCWTYLGDGPKSIDAAAVRRLWDAVERAESEGDRPAAPRPIRIRFAVDPSGRPDPGSFRIETRADAFNAPDRPAERPGQPSEERPGKRPPKGTDR